MPHRGQGIWDLIRLISKQLFEHFHARLFRVAKCRNEAVDHNPPKLVQSKKRDCATNLWVCKVPEIVLRSLNRKQQLGGFLQLWGGIQRQKSTRKRWETYSAKGSVSDFSSLTGTLTLAKGLDDVALIEQSVSRP